MIIFLGKKRQHEDITPATESVPESLCRLIEAPPDADMGIHS